MWTSVDLQMPSTSPCPIFPTVPVPASKTASRIRLISLIVGKFAMGGQEIEDVFKLFFIVVSLDFFMFDWFAKCESGQAGNRKRRIY